MNGYTCIARARVEVTYTYIPHYKGGGQFAPTVPTPLENLNERGLLNSFACRLFVLLVAKLL